MYKAYKQKKIEGSCKPVKYSKIKQIFQDE
jgi:hypothetical protein